MIIFLVSGLIGLATMGGAVTIRDQARAEHWRAVARERRAR